MYVHKLEIQIFRHELVCWNLKNNILQFRVSGATFSALWKQCDLTSETTLVFPLLKNFTRIALALMLIKLIWTNVFHKYAHFGFKKERLLTLNRNPEFAFQVPRDCLSQSLRAYTYFILIDLQAHTRRPNGGHRVPRSQRIHLCDL